MTKYGWLKHNGNDFGVQEIEDNNGVKIKTEYVKTPGGKHGGDWSVRISATVSMLLMIHVRVVLLSTAILT